MSVNRQFPILDWIFGYLKDWLPCDLIAGLIATATHQAAAGISNSGANEMVLTGWQLPADWHATSEQANFSSADIVSLIGKCLTPETGEIFLTEHKKLLVCVSSMQRNVQDFPPVVC